MFGIRYTGGLSADVLNLQQDVKILTSRLSHLIERNAKEQKARRLLVEWKKIDSSVVYEYCSDSPYIYVSGYNEMFSIEQFESKINKALADQHRTKCGKK